MICAACARILLDQFSATFPRVQLARRLSQAIRSSLSHTLSTINRPGVHVILDKLPHLDLESVRQPGAHPRCLTTGRAKLVCLRAVSSQHKFFPGNTEFECLQGLASGIG